MLLVSKSELVEENAVEVFHTFLLVLFFLDVKFHVLSEKNYVIISVSFDIFTPLANLWFICLLG